MDFLNSHDDKQPFRGDCRNSEEVDKCFCRIEIEDRQLAALLSLLFSLSLVWKSGSCLTAEILSASGRMQLQTEPAKSSTHMTLIMSTVKPVIAIQSDEWHVLRAAQT